MGQSGIPVVEDRWVCIATQSGLALAAMISSYFNEPGKFFAVFEFPALNYPYIGASESEQDGYFARVLGEKATTEINNALARIQPRSVLLLGLSKIDQTYIRAWLPEKQLIEVGSIEEFLLIFGQIAEERGAVSCKSSQLVEGLLAAKFSGKCLRVNEGAPDLPKTAIHGGKGIVVIDGGGDVHDVAAVNYAAAFDLDVAIVPSLDRQTIRALPHILEKWSKDNSHHEFKEFERKALKHIRGIDFRGYEFATFFTVGVPYGLFLKNVIPFSHVWKQIDCAIFIAINLMDDDDPRALGSSLHFSPQLFAREETDEVIRIFAENNFITKALIGDDATARNLSNFAGYYPYDVLHICSHGGETKGYYVVQSFKDRQGAGHQVEFYEVVQIDPVDTEMAQLTRKMIYQMFDGHKWGTEPLNQIPQYVFEDMSLAMRSDRDQGVIRVPVSYEIAFSCHIRCRNGFHQGAFHTLSDIGRPVVFNNSCASSHELAPAFVSAGARTYVGTLWEVGNETATRAAKTFYTSALKDGNLLLAFHEMTKQVTNKKYANVYIFWGLHFSSLRKPLEKSDDHIFGALLHSFLMWLRKISTTSDPEIRRNGLPIAAFLYQQLILNFTRDRLDKIRDFDPVAFEEMMRDATEEAEDKFIRGPEEIVAASIANDVAESMRKH